MMVDALMFWMSLLTLAYWHFVWGWQYSLFWATVWTFSAALGRSGWPKR